MRPGRSFLLPLAACLALIGLAGPAAADSVRLSSSDGPIFLELNQDGTVQGTYPGKQGRITGHISPDGSIHGLWLQPKSDHPCQEARYGTFAWGTFSMTNPAAKRIAASFGYCGEQPNRPWQVGRD